LVIERGVTEASASTICWLHEDAIRPWQVRSWIFRRDRKFLAKASRVLDLYDRGFEGRRLRPDEYVISADEKSRLQALGRVPREALRPGRGEDRDPTLRPAGRGGDDLGALRLGQARLLGGRQRLLPRRAGLGRAARGCLREPAPDPPAGVQRKALTPNDFDSLEELTGRLLAFQARYAEIARPFEWTFTRGDLERVIARVDRRGGRLAPAA
jgi:hypothetical protein